MPSNLKVRIIRLNASGAVEDRWPRWAKGVAQFKSKEDNGVGDTVHRMLGAVGEIFEATMRKIGVPCKCPERREEWNKRYPYKEDQ